MQTKLQVTAQEEQLRQSMRAALEQKDYEKIKEQLRMSQKLTEEALAKSKSKDPTEYKTKKIPKAPYGFKAKLLKFIGGFMAITTLLAGLADAGIFYSPQYFLPTILFGSLIFYYGAYIENLRRAYHDYAQVLIQDGKASFKELSFVRGKPINTVIKELEGLKKRNFFKRILIDRVHETLVIGPNTVARYLGEYAKKGDPEERIKAPEGFSNERNHLVTIEKSITRLEDGPVKDTIIRIQQLAKLIMDYAQDDKTTHQEIRRFLNHYLPMGASLIEQYSTINHQPFVSSSLESSKHNIEDSLTKMEEAFKNILLELSDKNALEIESSIGAMEYMFKSDGLTK